jgi:hypothetical protein
MGKFVISEEDKKHIKGLYEQSAEFFNSKDTYTPLIGYLVKLSENGGTNKGIEDMAAVKELRIYLESLRDGIKPQPLSKPAEIVNNYVKTEIEKLSGQELSYLKHIGRTTKTKM